MIFHTKGNGSEFSVSNLMPALADSAYEKYFGAKSFLSISAGTKISEVRNDNVTYIPILGVSVTL